MEDYLIWVVIGIALMIFLPLLTIEIYQRHCRRDSRARSQRRTDKIRL